MIHFIINLFQDTLFRFIYESYSFKRIIILTVIFIVLIFVSSKLFDDFWGSTTSIPLVNLNEVYGPPRQYNNVTKINIKLINSNKVTIEGNKKFRIENGTKTFSYYDTVSIEKPDTSFSATSKLYMLFEDPPALDSVFLVVSKSQTPDQYYVQVFYSSVIVNDLNNFSGSTAEFRIDPEKLVKKDILMNNDTLINGVFKYFNDNVNNLGLAECGTNSSIFKKICDDFQVPCRLIWLQGGNIDETGYDNSIGYPLHVMCEIYSSNQHKWYVVDPLYGFRFKNKDSSFFLSAAEISNYHSFNNVDELIPDTVLLMNNSIIGKDYFKYYENLMFDKNWVKNAVLKKINKYFYSEFNSQFYIFSNQTQPKKNGVYYIGLKTFMYFMILIFYINSVLLVMAKRLFSAKKP